ncbi:Helix-turn-helix [Lachnospiraceae bacterium XBD2001]|nr:Helix-turn-helix [Lachnospiraceae bacterium XBD2001]
MEIIENQAWRYYLSDDQSELRGSVFVGKWMLFPSNIQSAEEMCRYAIENSIVVQAKHSLEPRNGSYLCCFYMNIYDYDRHEGFIKAFLGKNYIPRTQSGRYYNIAYKLDAETYMGMYGNNYKGLMHLVDFIDLDTGQWSDLFIKKKEKYHLLYTINTLSHQYIMPGFPEYASLKNVLFKHGKTQRLRSGDVFNYSYVEKMLTKKGITYKQVADRMDVSEGTVRKWLSGKSRPCVWYVFALATYYGLDSTMMIKNEMANE